MERIRTAGRANAAIRPLLAVLLAAAAAMAVSIPAPGTAEAGEAPSKRYRDRNAKFSFRIFDDWDQVPVETESKFGGFGTDQYCAAQLSQSGAMEKGKWAGWCRAYRMGRGTTGFRTTGETTGEPGMDSPPTRLPGEPGSGDPNSMKELFDQILDNYGFLEPFDSKAPKPKGLSGPLDPKAAKAIETKDGVPGQMWVVERMYFRYREPKPFFHVFACWKKDDMEVGLWLHCGPDQKKKFEQGFVQVAKSFKWFDDKAEDVESISALDGLPMTRRRRAEIEKGLVAGWDVHVSPKRNYVLVYNTANGKNRHLAKVIGERIEAIREQVYERLFPPAAKIEAVSIVRICKDREEYFKYGGPGGSAGYWSDSTEELVFYDASPKRDPDDDTIAVLYHEAFHQYIYYSVGEVAPHSWFNEGTGDYFAGARYSANKFTIKPFNWRVGIIQAALRKGPVQVDIGQTEDGDPKMKFDWSMEGYIPLRAFVRMSQGEYYGPLISVCYAQGWSFNYFLREIVPKNPKWNEKWGKILPTYFDTLKAEVNKDSPLAPKKVKPEDEPAPDPDPFKPDTGGSNGGGKDDPGMDEPGMSEPGMEPGGMDSGEPGMDDGGMDDPGMDDDGGQEGGDEPPNFITPSFSRFSNSARALRLAVETAFQGVDWAELEKAWKDSILKVH